MNSSGTYTIPNISLGDVYGETKSQLPNKKLSFDVHKAHGGYIVQVQQGLGHEADLYIVAEDQDLGQEIGKIITHNILNKQYD
jgi:hypothetical protein